MGIWSIRLFQIRGIKLELHLTFLLLWAVFAFIGWSHAGLAGLGWFSLLLFLIFVCVVLHELGHSLAAQRYDIPVSRILLLPFGGMAQLERIPRDPWKEIVISVAGPAVNVLIVALLLPVMLLGGITSHWVLPLNLTGLLQALLIVNVIMGLFNLLPIFPMDGGRILRAVLALRFSYLRATATAAHLAKGLAVVGIILSLFWYQQVIFAFLLAFICVGGDMEYRMVKRREIMLGLYVRDLTRKHFLAVPSGASMAEAAQLFASFRPEEMMVMEDNVPKGYLTARQVRLASKKGLLQDPVDDHCIRKFSVLQAGWPLDPFVEMISQSPQRIYPVYLFGNLVGVIDTRNLERLIAWHRRQEQERRLPSRSAPPLLDHSPAEVSGRKDLPPAS
jgi:Zn-dependent protease